MQQYEYKILIHPDDLMKIAVTCICKVRTVFEVPGFLVDGTHPVLVHCKSCHQNYVIHGRKTLRVDENFMPVTGNGLMQKATPSVMESEDKTLDGKFVSPGNDQVN